MSQALNKVEMTVKITEIGFLLIKFQNFRSKKKKKNSGKGFATKKTSTPAPNTATNDIEMR